MFYDFVVMDEPAFVASGVKRIAASSDANFFTSLTKQSWGEIPP